MHMKRSIPTLILVALILAQTPLFPVQQAMAGVFDPGLVLTEQDLFNSNTMTSEAIQTFLDGHTGVLKSHVGTDVDGLLKTAAMMIHDAAARYGINPQYLLTLLQKEQGLITNPTPKVTQIDWATGYAACDSCDVDHPGLQKYKGFANQIDRAAWRTRYFYDNPSEFVYQSNATYVINGQEVFIKNQATAVLYNYTPHISGNRLFWKIYENWFRPLTHPEGSLLQGYEEPGIWLIGANNTRHAFKSKAALTSRYSIENVIAVDPRSLEQYAIGPAIPFAEYALVLHPNGKVYLLAGKEKRWIEDEATFKALGFTWDEVEIAATEQDLAFFSDGEPVNASTAQPFGALIQDPESFGIYFVIDGMKYPLVAPELLTLNFSNMRVRKAAEGELERYEKGAPVLLRDGLLVKSASDPRVYVIANGKKLPIFSEATFNALGYQWNNIQAVSDGLLTMHETGDLIRVEPLTDEEIGELAAAKASQE